MDDSAPVVFKISLGRDLRRVTFPRADLCSCEGLWKSVSRLFSLSDCAFHLAWTDDDGDETALKTDGDLREAIAFFSSGPLDSASDGSLVPSELSWDDDDGDNDSDGLTPPGTAPIKIAGGTAPPVAGLRPRPRLRHPVTIRLALIIEYRGPALSQASSPSIAARSLLETTDDEADSMPLLDLSSAGGGGTTSSPERQRIRPRLNPRRLRPRPSASSSLASNPRLRWSDSNAGSVPVASLRVGASNERSMRSDDDASEDSSVPDSPPRAYTFPPTVTTPVIPPPSAFKRSRPSMAGISAASPSASAPGVTFLPPPLTPPRGARVPLALQVHRSAFPSVLARVAVFALYAYVVVLAVQSPRISTDGFGPLGTAMAGILSMVTGLMVSFRSESSNARWREARVVWEDVQTTTRGLIRALSISLPVTDATPDLAREKIEDVLGLVVAFPMTLSHHLRGEKGISHLDLDGLLPRDYIQSLRRAPSSVRFAPHPLITQIPAIDSRRSSVEMLPLPKASTVFPDPDPPSPTSTSFSSGPIDEASKQEAFLNTSGSNSLDPLDNLPRRPRMGVRTASTSSAYGLSAAKSALAPPMPSNLPLSILRLLHAYLEGLAALGPSKDGLNEGARERCFGLVDKFNVSLGQAESIRDTPIPLALSIHLHQMLALLLLSIPPQLAPSLGKWTVPVTAIAAFCFLGVDSIGEGLSDPFGQHEGALPLQTFTSQILQESMELGGPFAASYLARLAAQRRRKSRVDANGGSVGWDGSEERLKREWERRGERWLPDFEDPEKEDEEIQE